MTIKTLIISLIVMCTILSCNNPTKNNIKIEEIVNKELEILLSYSEINAVSLGVYLKGEVYKLHKGELTQNAKNKPNNKTVYEIASLTKTFTGTLLAKAINENKIQLDDDIRTVLKDDFPNLEYDNLPITFRHLLTHRSGLPKMFPNKPELFENPDYSTLPHKINKLQKGYTKEDFFNDLRKIKLDTIPGTKFNYSNAGANLIGYCLESIYKKPYEEILQQNILKPLKMNNTKITLSDNDLRYLAQGYNEKNLKMPWGATKDMNAEGGIKSGLDDMMKYVAYNLDLSNPIIKTSQQELLSLWEDYDNGFFWQIIKENGKPSKIFQNGGSFGTSSWLTLIPERQIGIFIITNESDPKTHQRLNNTVDKIIEKLI